MADAKSAGRLRKGKASDAFSDDERAAMQEYVKEKRAQKRGGRTDADGERELLDKVAGMPEPDRSMATRVHAIVKAAAPGLVPRTWYGMPAYAKDGKVLCFFQPGSKFKVRYALLGFQDVAALDDGEMWPTSFALQGLTPEVEARIAALVKKAAG